jgi:aryl-alcohol dehydrogenase-like predicted oxidoreductase/spore coat polysaccharide biosynthesis protein SpsF (cytidylyltransferase family)
LPAKVFLPIAGIPLVVLAAKRAANTGRKVIVAIPKYYEDDGLFELLKSSGVTCFRGAKANVLQRFVDALIGYADDTLVFRLTADNVFPDGSLLDEIEEEYLRGGYDYLVCNERMSGLPYGVSVELMRARHLRTAARLCTSDYEREHVTPYIRKTYGEIYFRKYHKLNRGNLRCTVDRLDDYLLVQEVFKGVDNPIFYPTLRLIERLTDLDCNKKGANFLRKMVIGTAQLGSDYGLVNHSGQPSEPLARSILLTAADNGVRFFDTARAYGESEAIIGRSLSPNWKDRVTVITKLSPLSDLPADFSSSAVRAHVDASVFQSCVWLGLQALDVLLLHRASQIKDHGGAIWNRLLELRELKKIKRLGVSVQTPQELIEVIAVEGVSFIQLPFNVLDWRWEGCIDLIRREKSIKNITIHARSALLQGLLLARDAYDWNRANEKNPGPVMSWLQREAIRNRCASITEFCLTYVRSQDWVDGVVVGVETLSQLEQNIQTFSTDIFSSEVIRSIATRRLKVSEEVLNPAMWRH